MKSTPIFILLLMFFLNFDLAWGSDIFNETPKVNVYGLQTLLDFREQDEFRTLSLNLVYILNQKELIQPLHNKLSKRIRLNIGLTNILTELDFEVGKDLKIYNNFHFMPYVSLGTNIYTLSYGVGVDLKYMLQNIYFIGNINYKGREKLLGFTEAHQWYQEGISMKLGLEYTLQSLQKQ